MLQTSLKQQLAIAHTLIVVFCNSFAVAKCDTDCIVCSCKVKVLDTSCSVCRVYDRFSFCTIVYSNTSLNCFLVGSIQCKRNVVKISLKELNCPLHQVFSIAFCRSNVYIKISSTSFELLLCSFQDRLRISLCECFVDDRCGSGKSLTNCYKFCHCVFSFYIGLFCPACLGPDILFQTDL